MVAPGQVGEQSTPIRASQQLQLLLLLGCPTSHHLLLKQLKDAETVKEKEKVEKSSAKMSIIKVLTHILS